MNPNSGENQPSFEYANKASGEEERFEQPVESSADSSREEKSGPPSGKSGQIIAAPLALPSDQTVIADDSDDASPSADDQLPSNVANADRIEKEWVDRAKSIVAETKDDPFAQKSQISKVSAEYIRKRFNRTVKTDDTVVK